MTVKSASTSHAAQVTASITGEELFKLGDIGRTELVKGEIILVSPTGHLHGYIENEFGRILGTFVHQRKLGRVLSGEVGIYTRRNPDTVRGADLAFISSERLAQVQSESYLDVAPELIVKVLSPDDRWSEVMEKLAEYFAIGVRLVWVADPRTQQLYVYHSITNVERFGGHDELSGGDVLPDFRVPVAELLATE
jgi:Uma2 family endonuclease